MADLKDLLGTWTMLSWKKETVATGETVDAHGPDPVGYITYGSCILPSAEKLRLFDSLLAYSGTYTVDDKKVIHHVDVSWNQAFTNTDQIRFYTLADGTLTITTEPAIDPYSGKEVIHRLEFRKA